MSAMAPPTDAPTAQLSLLEVTIRGFEVAPEGHTVYIIEAKEDGCELATAKHRFSDFARLHNELVLPQMRVAFPVAKALVNTETVKWARVAKLEDYLRSADVTMVTRANANRIPQTLVVGGYYKVLNCKGGMPQHRPW